MSEPPSPTSGGSAPPSRGTGTRLPSLGPRGEGWLLIQLVFIAVIAAAGALFGANWSGALRFATGLAGAVLILAGGLLGYLGIRDLDRSLSPLPRPTETAVLIQHGIYRRLLHPIYAGVILLALGWALLSASLVALLLAAVLSLVLDLKARREEVWLRQRYPGYAAYAARTKRFVPGLY